MEIEGILSGALSFERVVYYMWEAQALGVDTALVAEKCLVWLFWVIGSLPGVVFPGLCQIDKRIPLLLGTEENSNAEDDDTDKSKDDANHEQGDYGDPDDGIDDNLSGEEGESGDEWEYEDDSDTYSGEGSDDNEEGYEDDDDADDEDSCMEEDEDDDEESEEEGQEEGSEEDTDNDDRFPLLRDAREVYNSNSFRMFEYEHRKSRALDVDVESEKFDARGLVIQYKAQKVYSFFRHYTVTAVPSDGIVDCSCKYFESSGILCSHVQRVLRCLRIEEIPNRYILKRMAKNVPTDPTIEAYLLKEIQKGNHHSPDCIDLDRSAGAGSD